jgi:hypothetical protein
MPKRASKTVQTLIGCGYGTFAAIIGTLMHQTQVGDGVPLGLLFSLSLVLMLSASIRDRHRGKLSGLVFAVTLATLLFTIGQNLTGDILIPGNNAGLWWSYGAIGVAALVALWPQLKS